MSPAIDHDSFTGFALLKELLGSDLAAFTRNARGDLVSPGRRTSIAGYFARLRIGENVTHHQPHHGLILEHFFREADEPDPQEVGGRGRTAADCIYYETDAPDGIWYMHHSVVVCPDAPARSYRGPYLGFEGLRLDQDAARRQAKALITYWRALEDASEPAPPVGKAFAPADRERSERVVDHDAYARFPYLHGLLLAAKVPLTRGRGGALVSPARYGCNNKHVTQLWLGPDASTGVERYGLALKGYQSPGYIRKAVAARSMSLVSYDPANPDPDAWEGQRLAGPEHQGPYLAFEDQPLTPSRAAGRIEAFISHWLTLRPL